MRRACPACPDGNVWTAEGPTGKACPVCGGNAYIVDDEADDLDEPDEGDLRDEARENDE